MSTTEAESFAYSARVCTFGSPNGTAAAVTAALPADSETPSFSATATSESESWPLCGAHASRVTR